MASTGMPIFFSGQVNNALASPLGIWKQNSAFVGTSRMGGTNSREPFEKPAFQHGERRCRPISLCAALRDGRHDDRRFPFL
jgi:hypothetical protein